MLPKILEGKKNNGLQKFKYYVFSTDTKTLNLFRVIIELQLLNVLCNAAKNNFIKSKETNRESID